VGFRNWTTAKSLHEKMNCKQHGPTQSVEAVQYQHVSNYYHFSHGHHNHLLLWYFLHRRNKPQQNTKVPSCLEHTCIIVIMNISSSTAPDKPRLPIEPSSMTLYHWPPSSLDPKILQIFYPTIHPQVKIPPLSRCLRVWNP